MHQVSQLNLGQKAGLKEMMTRVEHAILTVKLNLKLQC